MKAVSTRSGNPHVEVKKKEKTTPPPPEKEALTREKLEGEKETLTEKSLEVEKENEVLTPPKVSFLFPQRTKNT